MTGALIKRRKFGQSQREGDMKTQRADGRVTGVIHLQTEECQGWPENSRS